jgi:hypothetical protein
MFEDLPALASDGALLHALGAAGGPCDGSPFEAAGGDDAAVAAGWPFFGQFVAHDITADRSPLGHEPDSAAVRNFRTPRANLECVYGGGPTGSPYLFDRDDPVLMLLGEDPDDVPRNHQGIALIGDPRNDVHFFVNQLHVAFLRAHNLLVHRLREDGTPEADVFEEARRALMWHYQWVLLNDFLPTLIGEELSAELLRDGPKLYLLDEEPYIPFEFADAAYRYGHSQIRHSYRINSSADPVPLFPDLIGLGPAGLEGAIDWTLFFDPAADGARAQRAKRIDGRLPASLINLPVQITGEVEEESYHSLAARDLQRGSATGLPSGEDVARRLRVEPLTDDEVGLRANGWDGETPLWFYILREADVRADGNRLGEVGGRIVGEVLVGIVDADAESYRAVDRSWRPTLPASDPARYTLLDLLTAA